MDRLKGMKRKCRYWDPSRSISNNVQGVLSTLGSTLADPPRADHHMGRSPFESPWCDVARVFDLDGSSNITSVPRCMLIDRAKLKAGMRMQPRRGETSSRFKKNPQDPRPPPNYVLVDLGSFKGRSISEYCHRFICAVINGPPSPSSGLTDVIHLCRRQGQDSFGDPGCINPLHMVFGSPRDNRLAGPKATARHRVLLKLAKARRPSSSKTRLGSIS